MSVWVLQHVDERSGHLRRQLVVLMLHSFKVHVVSESRHERQEQPARGGRGEEGRSREGMGGEGRGKEGRGGEGRGGEGREKEGE